MAIRRAILAVAVITAGTLTLARSPTTATIVAATTDSPPTAVLRGSSGQVTGDLGSYCWPQPDGGGFCRHVDFVLEGPNPTETLTVAQAEALTLRFEPSLDVATLSVAVWSGNQII